jgi:perosamine synthetase
MDEIKMREAITEKTKAVISVSLLGKPARMAILRNTLSFYNNIYLFEDAAQALGAFATDYTTTMFDKTCRYKKIGTCSDIASFSFQESKTITTLGEGGMIVTDNDRLADLCRHIRNHGNTYGVLEMNQPCTNARMTEAQATFGRVQLTKMDEFIHIQRRNAQVLFEYLKEPLRPIYTETDSIYYLIPFILDGKIPRSVFIEKCKEAGINEGVPGQSIGYYKKLVYDNPIFQQYKPKGGCPNAEWARDNVILFDIHRWNKTPADMAKCAIVLNQITKNL